MAIPLITPARLRQRAAANLEGLTLRGDGERLAGRPPKCRLAAA
jgi:hypothetical protein